MKVRRPVGLSLAALLVLAIPGVGSAHDHHAPMALLKVQGFPHRGRLVSVDWVTRRDGHCVEKHRERDFNFGQPDRVDLGLYPVRLRLLSSHRPRLRILSWLLVDGAKQPVGPPEEIPFEMEPLSRGGRTLAWDAVFRIAMVEHRYLAVRARWPDREGCDEMQRATWTYHLRGL